MPTQVWNETALSKLKEARELYKTPKRILEHSPWLRRRFSYQQISSKLQWLKNQEDPERPVAIDVDEDDDNLMNLDGMDECEDESDSENDDSEIEKDEDENTLDQTEESDRRALLAEEPKPLKSRAAQAESRKHNAAKRLIGNLQASNILPSEADTSSSPPATPPAKRIRTAGALISSQSRNIKKVSQANSSIAKSSYSGPSVEQLFTPFYIHIPRSFFIVLALPHNATAKMIVLPVADVLQLQVTFHPLQHSDFRDVIRNANDWPQPGAPQTFVMNLTPPKNGYQLQLNAIQRMSHDKAAIWHIPCEEYGKYVPMEDKFSV